MSFKRFLREYVKNHDDCVSDFAKDAFADQEFNWRYGEKRMMIYLIKHHHASDDCLTSCEKAWELYKIT